MKSRYINYNKWTHKITNWNYRTRYLTETSNTLWKCTVATLPLALTVLNKITAIKHYYYHKLTEYIQTIYRINVSWPEPINFLQFLTVSHQTVGFHLKKSASSNKLTARFRILQSQSTVLETYSKQFNIYVQAQINMCHHAFYSIILWCRKKMNICHVVCF